MYAGTKVKWHEILMPDSAPNVNDESLPLFLCAFSADKGSEDITEFTSTDFKNMYGDNPNFFKHGQPLLQAHAILNAGGRVMGKRLVADDATLGNVIIAVQVSDAKEQKKDKDGNPLYYDADGNETTEVTDDPVMIKKAKLKYMTTSIPSVKSLAEVSGQARNLISEDTYPLFVICDNGRGVSTKKIRITPDYDVSRKRSYMLYKLSDIEGAYVNESVRFSVYPEADDIVNGVRKNMFLTNNAMVQLDTEALDDVCESFVEKLASLTDYSKEDIYGLDMLFGCTVRGTDTGVIIVDKDGSDITSDYGIELLGGTNGSFGDAPFAGTEATPAWTSAAINFFNGTFSPEIYDLDQHKIDFCVDANYPDSVKSAISDLAIFREDFYYLRDFGTSVTSIADVEGKLNSISWSQSPFVGDYCSTYDIIDSYSHKQIKVTMLYGVAPLLVSHFSVNAAAPLAGEFNNFVITNAIPNTLNIIPRITPTYDQKQMLDDLRVNFLNLSSDTRSLAVQSTYTSQDHEGPLSYAGNVIVTQMVVKAIRRYCPKIRFMLMDPGTTDFSKYKMLIEENVINKYTPYFKSIQLVYTRDDEMVASKIFNASLLAYYRDFPMGEIFDVFAIEGSPDTNPVSL